jgi:spermidine/putrescine transport system permease protein
MHRPEIMKRIGQDGFSWSKLVTVLAFAFLFLPLVVLVLYSFNESKTFRWTGFSLKWYEKLFTRSPDLWGAFGNSALVAFGSAAVATALGTLGAIGCARWKFKLRGYVTTTAFLPMVLPEIVMGVSLAVFFSSVGLPKSFWTVFAAHVCFELPFAFMLVSSSMEDFDRSIIEAAYDLGASEAQALFRVIIPCIAAGIASAFLTSVTLSLEDFIITYFTSGPGFSTLPIVVNNTIRFGETPLINALSAIMIAGTVGIAVALRRFIKNLAA